MKLKISFHKIFVLLISISLLFFNFGIVDSRTLEEVESELDEKKEQLESVEDGIKTLESEIDNQKKELEKVTNKREKLKGQIDLYEKESEMVREQLDDLQNKREVAQLEKEHREIVQSEMLVEFYLDWKQESMTKDLLNSSGDNLVKVATYRNTVTKDQQGGIEVIEREVLKLEDNIKESQKQKEKLEKILDGYTSQIERIENELVNLDLKIESNQGDIANYRAKVGILRSEIDQLTEEQEEIQAYEASLLKDPSNGGTKELIEGQIYFQGVGRELYQGHGVGMSQFGALGAALKGWDYKKILEFYYPGAKVKKYSGRDSISVKGYGTMSIHKYASGAGEIPDYACEDLGIEFDKSNVWKCWPKEAIKAQIVAFKSYGLAKTKGGSSICTTAACQVYKGGDNKKWAADDTEGMIIVYEGEPISAFYSSDNHNGWGTANNDTVWSDFEGNGTPEDYLRSVNDSEITFHYSYTDWGWRTNGYSIEDIGKMLGWGASSPKASSSYREFLTEVNKDVGELTSLTFERDPSGRVNKVKLVGTKGERYVAGWLFKSIWNIWIGNELPSGEKDFIYSLTYYLREK